MSFNQATCVFCGAKCHKAFGQRGSDWFYSCENCGKFDVYEDEVEKNEDKKHLIAGFLYEFNRGNGQTLLINFGQMLSDGRMPKTPMQRLERFLLNLYKADDKIGLRFSVNQRMGQILGIGNSSGGKYPLSMSYARDYTELNSMFEGLAELGHMAATCHVGTIGKELSYFFTPKGFERAERLLSTNIDSKTVFVAMGFKDDLIEACEKVIKPACAACGFDAFLISDKAHNNGITDEIITEIKRSKFVIVDFTYNNSGAYFEAGYAQGLGRPVIRCCKKEWLDEEKKKIDENGNPKNPLHFDVQHYNTILWENHDDLYKRLKENIRANIGGAVLVDE